MPFARISILLLLLHFLTISCKKQEPSRVLSFDDQLPTFSTKGITIPSDSLKPPRLFKMKNLKSIPSGEPTIIELKKDHIELQPLGIPVIVKTVGSQGNNVPEAFNPMISVVKAGKPEKVLLKNPDIVWEATEYFTRYTESQGLRPGGISHIIEDHKRNYWMGSNLSGIYRFDGKHLYSYSEKQGLIGNGVTQILQDKNLAFWISTSLGISHFDGVNFTNYIFPSKNHNDNGINSLVQDHNKNLWIASNDGLYRMNSQSRHFMKFDKTSGLLKNSIRQVSCDKNGRLWIFYRKGGGSLLTLTSDKYSPFIFNHFSNEKELVSREFTDLHEDADGNYWLASMDGVLILTETASNSQPYFSMIRISEEHGLPGNQILSIEQDTLTKEIFMLISEIGLSILSKEGKTFELRVLNSSEPFEYAHLFRDSQNTVWEATQSGFSKITHDPFNNLKLDDHIIPTKLSRITEDKWGRKWFGSYGDGIFLYEPTQNKVSARLYQFTKDNGMSSGFVDDIVGDNKGNLWIGLRDYGLIKMELKEGEITGTFTNYLEKDGFPAGLVPNLLVDKNDDLWCTLFEYGTQPTSGICRVREDEIMHIGKDQGLINEDTWDLEQDFNGNLWVGSARNGLTKFQYTSDTTIGNVTHFTRNEHLLGLRIWSLEKDHLGNIWVGANGGEGLVQISPMQGDSSYRIKHLTVDNGLIHNNITALHEDFLGNLWIGSRGGLSRLTQTTDGGINNIINYTHADGFPNSGVFFNGIHQAVDSTIWVKTNSNLGNFKALDLEETYDIPKLILNDILLFNEKLDWEKESPIYLRNQVAISKFKYEALSKWNNLPTNLSLRHDNNFVGFEYNGVSTDAPHKLQYSYQLEGWSERWSAESKETQAIFGILVPGSYVFKVKAKYEEGEWSDPISYAFEIRPPWWKSILAYILYFILGLSGIALFIIFQIRRARWKISVLEEIRTNISLDLHDDVGTIMSGVAMQAEFLAAAKPKDINAEMTQISEMSRAAIEKMRDIVWALDPRRDKFENLIDRMHSFAEVMLGSSNFEYDFQTKGIEGAKFINPELRRNIYLIFKEALQNINKHSNGDYVNILFTKMSNGFSLSISDNGSNISESSNDGLGISNMKLRAEKIGANLKIIKNNGFTIKLDFMDK